MTHGNWFHYDIFLHVSSVFLSYSPLLLSHAPATHVDPLPLPISSFSFLSFSFLFSFSVTPGVSLGLLMEYGEGAL